MNEVDLYIQKQKSPQKEIIEKVRKIFLKTLPEANEQLKWGAIVYGGGKFYLAGMRERVHVGFSVDGLSKEEIGQLEGGGKTMRHVKISSPNEIDEGKLVKLIRLVDRKSSCEGC